MHTRPMLSLLALAALLILLPACTTSRYGQLRARSAEVESALKAERDEVLAATAPAARAESRQRLDHLTSLRYTLTAADLGLIAARRVLPEADRPLAYDAIEQAYDTIEWNIPLPPGQGTRPLPPAFTGGGFDINRFRSSRVTQPIIPPAQ